MCLYGIDLCVTHLWLLLPRVMWAVGSDSFPDQMTQKIPKPGFISFDWGYRGGSPTAVQA